MIVPKNTRLQRLQAVERAEDQENLLNDGVSENTAPPCLSDPTFFKDYSSVSPAEILNEHSVENFELAIGDLNDAMYISDVKEVICTNLRCSKRINVQGQEWSVGRLGNSRP